MTSKYNLYADYLYEIIEKNKEVFKEFERQSDNVNNNYNLNLNLLDEYAKKNPCITSCFEFIKNFYSEYTFIDKRYIKRMLYDNLYSVLEFIEDHDRFPIIVIPNYYLVKSNFFFTLYFMYSLQQLDIKIQKVYIEFCENQPSQLSNSLFSFHNSGSGNTYSYIDKSLYTIQNILCIICDDYLYSGSQMLGTLGYKSRQNNHYDSNFPSNFKLYINCIGFTKFSFDRIKNILPRNDKDSIIIGIEDRKNSPLGRMYFNNYKKSISEIIVNKYKLEELSNYSNLKSHKKKDFVSNFIQKLIFEADVFILTKTKINNVITINIKSILHDFFVKLNQIYIDRVTLTYLFFKYPDYASTFGYLCGLNLFVKEEEYYIIEGFKEICGGISFYYNHLLNDNIISSYFNENEIELLKTKWDNLEEEDLNFSNKPIKFRKCINSNNSKWYKLIKKNFNNSHSKNSNFTCNDYCIKSFYKTIKWIDVDNSEINIRSELEKCIYTGLKKKKIQSQSLNANQNRNQVKSINTYKSKINTKNQSLNTV
jgi:hypothetical protein